MRLKRFFPLLCLLIVCGHFLTASAQSTIFVTRHADRYGTEPDPDLTPKGKEQAAALAQLLADANVRHIFTTELVRTQQTAAPLARHANVTPVVVRQEKFDDLIAQVRKAMQPNQSILVVSHRATVPQIVHALTGKDIAPLGSGEYGRLIMITLFPDGTSSVVTLRYAPPA
ncbi:MAG TPA: histidine phosphatase family protein [Acidobacteriaceae bacterium]|jgi:broad specificity phosphatase PhoE